MPKRFLILFFCVVTCKISFAQFRTDIFGDTIPSCLVTPQLEATLTGCVSKPAQVPYVEQSCFAGMDRLLARAVSMHKLSEQIRTPDPSCDYTPYRDVEAYVENIRMLVEMRATFVFWAGHRWGFESWLIPGEHCRYLESTRQTVCDINAAFDCAGVRRPVIQGTIYEHVDGPDITSIQYVAIPPEVIAAFADDRAFANNPTLYSNYFSGAVPRTDKMFNYNNVLGVPAISDINPPDVTRVEARMWMFYQAALLVDAGYTAIHMGDISQWGKNDRNDDGQYNDTWYLVQKIRNYANSKGSFMLLNTEPSLQIPSQIEIGGQQFMLFDFNATPLHFREMTLPPAAPTGGDPCEWGITPTCNDPYSQDDIHLFTHPPCNSFVLPAVVDLCVLNHFTEISGGLAPNPYDQSGSASHCFYTTGEVPSLLYFDLGNGLDVWAPNPVDQNGNCGSDGSTYGYDDTDWFHQMPADCQIEFFKYYQCKVRAMTGGNYYFPIPGNLLISSTWAPGEPALWQLNGHPDVRNGIQHVFNAPAAVPQIIYAKHCDKFVGVSTACNGVEAGEHELPFGVYAQKHTFSVANDDCVSIYTWHIKDPAGNWLPFFLKGNQVTLEVTVPGTYEVYLRCDNMALNDTGSLEFGPFRYDLEPICCNILVNPLYSLKAYPNPTKNKVKIEYHIADRPETSDFTLRLFSSIGGLLKEFPVTSPERNGQFEFDLSAFPSGLYIFALYKNGSARSSQRLIVSP